MRKKLSLGLALSLATGLLSAFPGSVEAGTDRNFPLRGIVSLTGKGGLTVREAPPTATPLSYKLAARICAIGNGSEFVATDEAYIANGEIWFEIHTINITKRLGDPKCPAQGVSGWMAAKLKSRWAVKITEQGVDLSSVIQQVRATEDLEEGGSDSDLSFLFGYFLLLLGTALAAWVVMVERTRSLKPRRDDLGHLIFEFVMLGAINVTIVAVLIGEVFEVPEPTFMFSVLAIVYGSKVGYLLLGFFLSTLFLRFMSFAHPQGAQPVGAVPAPVEIVTDKSIPGAQDGAAAEDGKR